MIVIYTDGGYRPITNVAGWAYLIKYFDFCFEGAGAISDETEINANRLEMIAIINACEQIKPEERLHKVALYTDSDYCYAIYRRLIEDIDAVKKHEKNLDLVDQFKNLVLSFKNLEFFKIKRRSDDDSRKVDNMVRAVMNKKEVELAQLQGEDL